MPGPLPKHPSTRARRNKGAGAKVLTSVPDMPVPTLHADRDWHAYTVAWWSTLWASPMAPEYDNSDIVLGLRQLAVEVNWYWTLDEMALGIVEDDGDAIPALRMMTSKAAEIRLQGQRFGTSPLDRRRLQWEVSRGEEAEDRTLERRAARRPAATTKSRQKTRPTDPRSLLA